MMLWLRILVGLVLCAAGVTLAVAGCARDTETVLTRTVTVSQTETATETTVLTETVVDVETLPITETVVETVYVPKELPKTG